MLLSFAIGEQADHEAHRARGAISENGHGREDNPMPYRFFTAQH